MLVKVFFEKLRKDGPVSAAMASAKYAFNALDYRYRRAFLNSHSQYGEDLVLERLISRRGAGFYVDVGAYDPVTFSNTKHFHDLGWTGINIEPNQANFKKFQEQRSKDINLNIGVSKDPGLIDLYVFDAATLCTFSKKDADDYISMGYKLVEVRKVEVKKLSDVFASHLGGSKVDFMSVDAEGYDLSVLESNDWSKYRPSFICVESIGHRSGAVQMQSGIEKFLFSKGYSLKYFNGLNGIYADTGKMG